MARQNFQDIIPPERRSIQKIPIPERRRTQPVPEIQSQKSSQAPQPPRQSALRGAPIYQELPAREDHLPPKTPKASKQHGSRMLRIIFTLLALIIILGAGFWFVSRVSNAEVTVTPKEQQVSVDSEFSAISGTSTPTGTAADSSDSLQFQTITIQKDGKLDVTATGQEMANDKATGVIVIYNTTKNAQKLVANTRFETSNGLIFRISQPITIPGTTNGTPGTAEASITADQAGPDYNVGLSDFTIPGFQGDPRYTEIYARSKTTSPVQGGFSGMKNTIAPADLQAAQQKIDTELASNLVSEAKKDIPTGYVLPTNAYYIEYESLQTTNTDTGVEVNEEATFHGIIFNRQTLAENISKKAGGNDTNDALDMTGIDNLTFTLSNPNEDKPWEASTLDFSLQGTTTLVSVIDPEKIKEALVGQPRKSLNAILTAYPAVDKAEVTMRPFWKTTFPTDKDQITVSINNPPVSP